MAVRRTKRRYENKVHKTSYMSSYNHKDFLESLQCSVTYFGVNDAEIAEIVLGLCGKFASEFSRIAKSFNSAHLMGEFYNACKARFSDLTSLNNCIIADIVNLDIFGVVQIYNDGSVHPFHMKWSDRLAVIGIVDGDQCNLWVRDHRRPGCYKYLLLAELILINYVQEYVDTDIHTDALRNAKYLSLLVTSVGKLYEDMRPNDEYININERESLNRLKEHHTLDKSSPFYITFLQVIDDIKSKSRLPYIRDIVSAISRTDVHRKYSYDDYHVSFKKTGTSYKGKSLPGIYASIVEIDDVDEITSRFDDYTGYISTYNKNVVPSVVQYGTKTLTIEQQRLDRRVIHLASNPRQDRLSYIHHICQEVLDNLQVDCTRNQFKGVEFARMVTSVNYRSQGNSVYSLDISKATDTIDLEFQKMCLSAIFSDEVVDYWMSVNLKSRFFVFHNGTIEEYVQDCGQPQGFKSSFPAFAWAHHMVMRIVMRHLNLVNEDPRLFYRVLGDDAIISTPNPDYTEEILQCYIDVCAFMGWHTNRSKGFIAKAHQEIAFAEFAKKCVLNGRIVTPIPMKLLLQGNKSIQGAVSLAEWISGNLAPMTVSDAIRSSLKLSSLYSEEEISLIEYVSTSRLLPTFEKFVPSEEELEYGDLDKLAILLSYYKPKLQSTLIDQVLPDSIREVGKYTPFEIPKDYFLGNKAEKELFPFIEHNDHKYIQIIQNNSDIIDAIKHILGDSTVPEAIVSLQLKPEEYDVIYSTMDIFEQLEYGSIPDPQHAIHVLHEAIKILTRYNPRSDTRTSYLNAHFLTTTVQNYREFKEFLSGKLDCNEDLSLESSDNDDNGYSTIGF